MRLCFSGAELYETNPAGGCHPYLRNVSAFSVNFHLNR